MFSSGFHMQYQFNASQCVRACLCKPYISFCLDMLWFALHPEQQGAGALLGMGSGLTKMAAFFAERARGGVGLMVTGGIAPNRAGTVAPLAAKLTKKSEAKVRTR